MPEVEKVPEIKLVFPAVVEPKIITDERLRIAAKGEEPPVVFEHTLADMEKWFHGFDIYEIDLNVEASVKTGGLVAVVIGAQASAGMKLVLKPHQEPTPKSR